MSYTSLAKKQVTDTELDLEFKHNFKPLTLVHKTKVLIDKYHDTIYNTEDESHGAHAMLDIMERDGFDVSYTTTELHHDLTKFDVLIIHGMPNLVIELNNDALFWKSPMSEKDLDSVVRWVANGGGLFLSLSHFPGGSGARPLLEAFNVKFRDGYAHSPLYPSFTSPKDGRCSNFFGMSEKNNLLNKEHDLYSQGQEVNKIDFHCGAAVYRKPEDVVIAYPSGTSNYNKKGTFKETSDSYAAMLAFEFGKGKVVIVTDQGLFRNFIFTFDDKEKVYVTITSPENDNANLFVNMMRWLSKEIN